MRQVGLLGLEAPLDLPITVPGPNRAQTQRHRVSQAVIPNLLTVSDIFDDSMAEGDHQLTSSLHHHVLATVLLVAIVDGVALWYVSRRFPLAIVGAVIFLVVAWPNPAINLL